MNYEEFKAYVMAEVKKYRKSLKYRKPFIRKGQAVFNIVDSHFGVARVVQFKDGIDCFHLDQNIEAFLQAAWKYIEPNLKSGS